MANPSRIQNPVPCLRTKNTLNSFLFVYFYPCDDTYGLMVQPAGSFYHGYSTFPNYTSGYTFSAGMGGGGTNIKHGEYSISGVTQLRAEAALFFLCTEGAQQQKSRHSTKVAMLCKLQGLRKDCYLWDLL